ncbi:aminoglycoside phosphotransferase [Microtetraspora sp. NBRC 13810]|uniref:phosphotransferase n=1 Tax=Microtetraspora sp. NBRC 13810 TaxID=3030990 RepID=UPI0024A1B710|nr:phosphotransferase [Microtetraspora sp. NBRC 13810]GLW10591.1 aminoglycoside phosphotransferase [Microtetraspora sp. NBRC 13810]
MDIDRRADSPGLVVAKSILRYNGHALREQLIRQRAIRATDVPVRTREVTREWLTAVLCGEHPGATIESCQIEDVSSGTSSRWRATVAYNRAGRDAGLPTELFAKTSRSWTQRLLLGMAGVLTGEPGFYKHIRPHLDIEAPNGYHGAVDPASGRSIALMEDVAVTKKATFCTPQTPISRKEMEDLLGSMATWHGHYWNAPELERHLFLNKTPHTFVGNLARFAGLEKRAKVGALRARDVMPQAITPIHDDLYRVLWRAMDLTKEGPQTFLHGDSHIGNVYKTESGRLGFGDWQVVMHGHWSYDVSYTIATGLAVEDRRAWERDLLAFYLERLSEAGGTAPGFDAAWLAYRQQMMWPYFGWLLSIGRSAIQPKFQPDSTSLGMLERASNAVLDLDTLGALGGSKSG